MKERPIDWLKYPVRCCMTLHHCQVCQNNITAGIYYYDGGYGRRAHMLCAAKDEQSRPYAESGE